LSHCTSIPGRRIACEVAAGRAEAAQMTLRSNPRSGKRGMAVEVQGRLVARFDVFGRSLRRRIVVGCASAGVTCPPDGRSAYRTWWPDDRSGDRDAVLALASSDLGRAIREIAIVLPSRFSDEDDLPARATAYQLYDDIAPFMPEAAKVRVNPDRSSDALL